MAITIQTQTGPMRVNAEVFGFWAVTPALEEHGSVSEEFFGITHVPTGRLLGSYTFNDRETLVELAKALDEAFNSEEWGVDVYEHLPADGQERAMKVLDPFRKRLFDSSSMPMPSGHSV